MTTNGTKDVVLAGKMVVSFTVPIRITNDALASWTFGGENQQKAVTDELLKSLGLHDKEFVTSTAIKNAFHKIFGAQISVKNSKFEITGTVEKKLTCPKCQYTPKNQTEKFCSKCGEKLTAKN